MYFHIIINKRGKTVYIAVLLTDQVKHCYNKLNLFCEGQTTSTCDIFTAFTRFNFLVIF